MRYDAVAGWKRGGTLAERLGRCMARQNDWAAVRQRPQMAHRTRGILTLLARRFGQERDGWWDLKDVRLTHQQLAAARRAKR